MNLKNTPLQHHYIVRFDDDTKTWLWDIETEELVFPDGTVYDTEIERWEMPFIVDKDELLTNELELSQQLQRHLIAMTEEARNG